MIVRSRFVKDDAGRAGHLLSTSNNRRVVEHRDLDRGCPGGLGQFLAFSSALTATHPRAKVTLGHFKISPSRVLSRRQLLRSVARVKRENGIGRHHPMRLIEHDKGDRPPHFHLLFSAVDPATGRVLSSKDNYVRDELVSRLLEIEFGEAITPGPRVRRNAADLRARGHDREAELLEAYEPVRRRGKDSEADRQQAARTKLPLAEFRGRLLSAVQKGVRAVSLPRALAGQGFSVAIGSRKETLMAVHDETGMALPFLGSIAIASGGRMVIEPSVIKELHRDAPPLAQARRKGAARMLERARHKLDREIDRGRFEAAIDGDVNDAFSRMRRARRTAEASNEDSRRLQSQAALRREALAVRREVARVGQLRIDRAFRTARILQSRRTRRIAFALVSGGVLLTGAGLAMALGAGVIATAAMKGYGGALRGEAQALIVQRRASRRSAGNVRTTIGPAAVPKAPQRGSNGPDEATAAAHSGASPEAGFDFFRIEKRHRVLAAMALETLTGQSIPVARDALERALGAEAFAGLAFLAKNGSALQRRAVRSWNGGRSGEAFAAEGAFRRAGETGAAKIMAGIGRQRVASERRQAKGRD